ncbi:hypothetical protein U1Q18_002370 [Sarracenia purpurea var. burkii]
MLKMEAHAGKSFDGHGKTHTSSTFKAGTKHGGNTNSEPMVGTKLGAFDDLASINPMNESPIDISHPKRS